MTKSRDEILTAIYSSFSAATPHDLLITKLGEAVKKAHDLADPGVLDALVAGEDRRLDEKFGLDELKLLRPDARDAIINKAREKWRAEQRSAQSAAEAAVTLLAAETEARLAQQRVLCGESDLPAANRTERLLAQLLDGQAEASADAWIDSRTPEETLARYTAATDDGPERTFIRVLERRSSAGVLNLGASKDPLSMARQFREAMTARQDARRDPKDLAILGTLAKLRVDLNRSATASALPHDARAAGRILATAGREGTLPRPARVTTPDTRAAVQ